MLVVEPCVIFVVSGFLPLSPSLLLFSYGGVVGSPSFGAAFSCRCRTWIQGVSKELVLLVFDLYGLINGFGLFVAVMLMCFSFSNRYAYD